MRVTNRTRERVGSIGAGNARQCQQAAHHFLYLLFLGVSVTDHRLLDLQCGVFGHREAAADGSADCSPACLPKQQCRLGIDVDEDLFDRNMIRSLPFHNLGKSVENRLDTFRQLCVRRADTATSDIGETPTCQFHKPETGHSQTGVNAENPHPRTGTLITGRLITGQLITEQLVTEQLVTEQLVTEQLVIGQLVTGIGYWCAVRCCKSRLQSASNTAVV